MGRLRPPKAWIAAAQGGGVTIRVHARPGSSGSKVGAVDPWRGALSVEVRARAEGGAANDEICEVIARALGVPPGVVELVAGGRSREKVVRVSGITEAAARGRLGGPL